MEGFAIVAKIAVNTFTSLEARGARIESKGEYWGLRRMACDGRHLLDEIARQAAKREIERVTTTGEGDASC